MDTASAPDAVGLLSSSPFPVGTRIGSRERGNHAVQSLAFVRRQGIEQTPVAGDPFKPFERFCADDAPARGREQLFAHRPIRARNCRAGTASGFTKELYFSGPH